MRKLGTEKEIEKKKQRTVIVVSVFMLAILVVSTVGFSFLSGTGFSDGNSNNAPAQQITNLGNQVAVNFEGQTFYLTNPPEAVEEIPTEISKSLNDYVNTQTYIDSANQEALTEIASVLNKYSRIRLACYGPCEEDLPEKDCTENLIIFKDKETSRVYQEQNCVFIEGDIRAVDAFLYKLLNLN